MNKKRKTRHDGINDKKRKDPSRSLQRTKLAQCSDGTEFEFVAPTQFHTPFNLKTFRFFGTIIMMGGRRRIFGKVLNGKWNNAEIKMF